MICEAQQTGASLRGRRVAARPRPISVGGEMDVYIPTWNQKYDKCKHTYVHKDQKGTHTYLYGPIGPLGTRLTPF